MGITKRDPQIPEFEPEEFPKYVNVYAISNEYLGPEEGDRYGLRGLLQSSFTMRVYSQVELEARVQELLPRIEKGIKYDFWDEIRIEDTPGEDFYPNQNYE